MLLIEKLEPNLVDICELFSLTRRGVVGNTELEILDEKVIFSNGAFKRIKRWYRGMHPGLGVIIMGLTGWETLVEQDVIIPSRYKEVYD